MVQQVISRGETNGIKEVTEDYIGVGDEHAMTFDLKEVAHFAVDAVPFNAREDSQNGNCFRHFPLFLILTTVSRLQYRLPY